jgi:hypothetical protein
VLTYRLNSWHSTGSVQLREHVTSIINFGKTLWKTIPQITINRWYKQNKPFPKMAGLWHCGKPHTFIKRQNASVNLCGNSVGTSTYVHHSRLQLAVIGEKACVPLHEKKRDRHQTGSDMSLTTAKMCQVSRRFFVGTVWHVTCHHLLIAFEKMGGSAHLFINQPAKNWHLPHVFSIPGWIIFTVRLQVK